MSEVTLDVPDIVCDACAGAIRRALGQVDGVGAVQVDVAAKRVSVEFDPIQADEGAIRTGIERAGFEVA